MECSKNNLDIDAASEGEKPLFLLLLGKKFFEFVIQDIVWGLARWWGIPKES